MRRSILLAVTWLILSPEWVSAQVGLHTRHDWTVSVGGGRFGLQQVDIEGTFETTYIHLGGFAVPVKWPAKPLLALATLLASAAIGGEIWREVRARRSVGHG